MFMLPAYNSLPYAFELKGEPGVYELDVCYHGTSKHSRNGCRGTFTPDNSSIEPTSDLKFGSHYDQGDRVRARSDGENGYETGFRGRLAALLFPSISLAFLIVPAPFLMVTLIRPFASENRWRTLYQRIALAAFALLFLAAGITILTR
ncbi:hypothetical protein [Actinocorallia aurantiaca]